MVSINFLTLLGIEEIRNPHFVSSAITYSKHSSYIRFLGDLGILVIEFRFFTYGTLTIV